MKKSIAFFLAVLTLILVIPQNVYVAERIIPSGISYNDIGTELDAYIKEYKKDLASVGAYMFDETGIIHEGYYGYSDIENKTLADKKHRL